MTTIFAKTILGALLIGAGLAAPLTTPALAGGQLSWTYAPTDRQAASTVSAGLQLYGLYNDIKSGSIRQKGRDNQAGLAQRGRDNLGIVQQRGDGHSGTLEQNGDRNVYGLFQFGRGASDRVVQTGNGGGGVTFTYGW